MIELKSVSKTYNKLKALYKVNLTLPKTGMIAIQGPSGCGKTTLLNCLAGLIPFEGKVVIDGYDYTNKSDSQNSLFRLANIGFIFQDFRLFENETVLQNILFPLDTLNNSSYGTKMIKAEELLKLVDLRGKEKQFVSTLSGGEKQRVCIARSMINDPKIILADEPTGALDEKNSALVMNMLSKISNKSLVIFVTHDDALAKKYGDRNIQMRDGRITHIIDQESGRKECVIAVARTRSRMKKPYIPISFVLKHSFHALKKKKIRSIICSITTSIGLIGVGLALSLSSFISDNVKQAYSSLIKKDQVIVSCKNGEKSKFGEYNASLMETRGIADRNKEYVYDIGVSYSADFEDIFKDTNELVLYESALKAPIRGITARSINEFEWLDKTDGIFYPELPEHLEDDEIYIGMPNSSVLDLCYLLRIERSVTSLSNYLFNNDCYVVFNFEHTEWDYQDQQILNLRGFTLSNDLKIYHTNHMWNKYMFEERMRLPVIEDSEVKEVFPWTLRRYNYLYCNNNIDVFLTFINNDYRYSDYVLEIATKKHFPLLYKDVEVEDRRRVLVFKNKLDCIDCGLIDSFIEYEPNLCDPIVGSSNGYVIYPANLMMGFAHNAFLSFDLDKINDAIDVETSVKLNDDQHIEYPEGILQGHFTKSILNGLSFNVLPEKVDIGRKPESLDEIVISSPILNVSGGENLNSTLYFSYPSSSIQTATGEIVKNYKTVPLKVVGIVNSTEEAIYHNYMWPISFFQSRIGLSMFELKCQAIAFSLHNSKKMDETISKLQKAFPDYSIINPLKDIDSSVEGLCGYVSTISFMFSLFASITSIMLLSICSYLHVYETRNEIGLARCIGANKAQASKFIYSHALTLAGISLVLSCVELISISLVISLEMNGSFMLNISIIPFLAMFGLALAISLIASLFITLSFRKHNPIEATKY